MTKIRNPRNPGRPKAAADQAPIQETILWTASKLFMENGYEPVSLQQIAKACQVTKASIYYHFTSKPELFKIAVTTILDKAYASTRQYLQEADTLESGLIRVAEAKIAKPHAEMETMMREAQPFYPRSRWPLSVRRNSAFMKSSPIGLIKPCVLVNFGKAILCSWRRLFRRC